MIVLRRDQKFALAAIEWLSDPSEETERSGRTTLIALALVRHAVRKPYAKIPVFDAGFTDKKRVNSVMPDTINCVLGMDDRFGVLTTYLRYVKSRAPYLMYLPPTKNFDPDGEIAIDCERAIEELLKL